MFLRCVAVKGCLLCIIIADYQIYISMALPLIESSLKKVGFELAIIEKNFSVRFHQILRKFVS